ncbi:Uncharacterized protein APZ42_003876 [Daphnia magna]|uniref:Uncharacterized protein n=1 Tax=Daphnia magna TaxID=35525 RepID=A0A164HDS8_9CRUS|nr:Uncharacterized protein APZ42_003876 [Daphnia magna]
MTSFVNSATKHFQQSVTTPSGAPCRKTISSTKNSAASRAVAVGTALVSAHMVR